MLLSQGDARRIALPDESVQCVVTSPPYWGLRSYSAGPGEIGLEDSPDAYVAELVAVFREVWRVLRGDGVVFLVLGDSYASASACDRRSVVGQGSPDAKCKRPNRLSGGLKEKDLCMIPARVALALQRDGWIVRADIIWAKGLSFCPSYSGSVMPESCKDRPSQSYEHVFLLAKQPRYFYDNVAVQEASTSGPSESRR